MSDATQTEQQQEDPKGSGLESDDYSVFEKAMEGETPASKPDEEANDAEDAGDGGDGGEAEDSPKDAGEEDSQTDESKKTGGEDGEESGENSDKPKSGELPIWVKKRFDRFGKTGREKDSRIAELERQLAEAKGQGTGDGGKPEPDPASAEASGQQSTDSSEDEYEPANYEYPPPLDEFVRGDESEEKKAELLKLHDAALDEWERTDRWTRGPYAKKKEKPNAGEANASDASPPDNPSKSDSGKEPNPESQYVRIMGNALEKKIESLSQEDGEGFSETGDAFMEGVFSNNGDITLSAEMAEHILEMDDDQIKKLAQALVEKPWKGFRLSQRPQKEMMAGLDALAGKSPESPPKSEKADQKPAREQPPKVPSLPGRGRGNSRADAWMDSNNFAEFEKGMEGGRSR